MKPELIFVNESDGKVTMTKQDLERIIEQAYNAGKAEVLQITPSTPSPYIYHEYIKNVPIRYDKITCDSKTAPAGVKLTAKEYGEAAAKIGVWNEDT